MIFISLFQESNAPHLVEIVFSICAIVTSLIALIYSIYQGRLARKHNEVTVKPYLDYSLWYSATNPKFSIAITNKGFGSAIIKKFTFRVDGKTLQDLKKEGIINWEDLSKYLGFPDKFDWEYLPERSIIAVNETIHLCSYTHQGYVSEIAKKFREAASRLTYDIEYTSLYEKRAWRSKFIGKEEVPLEKETSKVE